MQLREYMIKERYNASEIGAIAGLSTACITRYLNGDRGLSAASAAQISAATGGRVSIEELLFPDGVQKPARIAAKK